jgi:hypothetical protein
VAFRQHQREARIDSLKHHKVQAAMGVVLHTHRFVFDRHSERNLHLGMRQLA